MHQSPRRRLAAVVAAVVAVSFGTAAFAAPASAHHGPGKGKAGIAGKRGGGGCGCRSGNLVSLDVAASFLGLSTAQLQAQLKSGKSLAQIAATAGKSLDGLVQSITTAAKSTLDAAVSGGALTQGQAEAVLVGVPQQVASLVAGLVGGRCGLLRFDISAAATLLGLTPAQLRVQLNAGKTLAQIAAATGKSPAALVQALADAAKASISASVASGALTSAQGAALTAGVTQTITNVASVPLGG
jgi:urease accessory protein UreF